APASIAALGRRPPLRRDQEVALVRAAKAGDAQARAALVEALQQTAVPVDPDTGVAYEPVVDEPAEGEYERVLDAVEAEELASLLSSLSDRERTVLRWRYGLDGEE